MCSTPIHALCLFAKSRGRNLTCFPYFFSYVIPKKYQLYQTLSSFFGLGDEKWKIYDNEVLYIERFSPYSFSSPIPYIICIYMYILYIFREQSRGQSRGIGEDLAFFGVQLTETIVENTVPYFFWSEL
jgi:hypothetical protein